MGCMLDRLAPGTRALLIAILLALAFWLPGDGKIAHAEHSDPPWQMVVTADQTFVYSRPDRAAPPAGPLSKGEIVVVLGERRGVDGARWARTPAGFLPSNDVAEMISPWVAEVAVPRVSIYGKPFVASGVLRTARQGDLLRVVGVSRGLEGDGGTWWATTEGFLRLATLRKATSDWAKAWSLPDMFGATRGWWGTVSSRANVRVGPTRDAPVVGKFAGSERVKVLAEGLGQEVEGSPTWYRIDGGRYAGSWIHSSLVKRLADPKPRTTPQPRRAPAGLWIVVDRSAATLTLVQDGQPRLTTYVSLGRAGAATPTGRYSTFRKFRADRMSSRTIPDATAPYDLPNVPYTQYYREGGYAIHGTYWHDDYGRPASQGCINLTWADSAYLFALTAPRLPGDVDEQRTRPGEATPVVIVD